MVGTKWEEFEKKVRMKAELWPLKQSQSFGATEAASAQPPGVEQSERAVVDVGLTGWGNENCLPFHERSGL